MNKNDYYKLLDSSAHTEPKYLKTLLEEFCKSFIKSEKSNRWVGKLCGLKNATSVSHKLADDLDNIKCKKINDYPDDLGDIIYYTFDGDGFDLNYVELKPFLGYMDCLCISNKMVLYGTNEGEYFRCDK